MSDVLTLSGVFQHSDKNESINQNRSDLEVVQADMSNKSDVLYHTRMIFQGSSATSKPFSSSFDSIVEAEVHKTTVTCQEPD